MYENFFALKHRPFLNTPDTSSYFPVRGQEEALALLKYCADEGEGNSVLFGPPGSGKTLICHLLLDSLGPSQTAVFITNTHLKSVESLLQAILYDLSLPFEGLGEQELRLRLTDFLVERFSQAQRTLLFIDEAQHLDPAHIEELRLLTNLEGRSQKTLQVFLFGQNQLEKTLELDELEAFRQRLSAVTRLEPLDPEQTVEYIRAQIDSAGGSADSIFDAAALCEICERSRGIPRRINQLCHRTLLLAYAHEAGTVDAQYVEAAAAQLFLPADGTADHHVEAAATQTDALESVSTESIAQQSGPGFVEVGADRPANCGADGRDKAEFSNSARKTREENLDQVKASDAKKSSGVSRVRQLYSR